MPEMDLSVKLGLAGIVLMLILALVLFHVYFSPPRPRGKTRDDA